MTELLVKDEEVSTQEISTQETVEPKKDYTFEEVYELNSRGGRFELVKGELREKMGATVPHGHYIVRLASYLFQHVESSQAGIVSTDGGFILSREPRTLRFPDVSFVKQERIPAEGIPKEGYWEIVPDLAVEVVSPNDLMAEVFELAVEYVSLGVKEVWLIVPAGKCVIVFRSFEEQQILTTRNKIEGTEVVPGFTLEVGKLFS